MVVDPYARPLVTSDAPVALTVEVPEPPKHMQEIDGQFTEYVAVLSPSMAMIGGLGNVDRIVAADRAMVEHIRGATTPMLRGMCTRPPGRSSSSVQDEPRRLGGLGCRGKPCQSLDLFLTEYK